MPPKGYKTVTLPESLVQRLEELDAGSHTAAIRMLLAGHKTDKSHTVQLEATEYRKIADELEERLR